MSKKTILTYLSLLEQADYKKVISLFEEKANIFSPLYGKQSPAIFYRQLFDDTRQSRIKILDIYQGQHSQNWSVNFLYHWTLANGTETTFDCVDLFEFNEDGKITSLRIIYDTQNTRSAFEASDS
ncbi:MAG: hypothetical protein DHS20C18_52740 [Saprospiraceae bacterium]|nr:MAG: hypothetical protein DHS20C18_52740 [Saprospiraceae bacterium]